MNERHVLYRFFDADGVLLYIGISKHWPERMAQHRKDKYWFYEVSRIDLEEHDDQQSALDAERRAIQSQRPRHNVVHNTPHLNHEPSLTTLVRRAIIRPGDVVALGMTGNRCPVGYVENCDGTWVTLTLKDWLTGSYCGRTSTYRLDDVAQIEMAGKAVDGVFQDDHLATFQSSWLAK